MNNEWQSLQPQTQQELKNTMNAMQPPQSIEEIKAGLETTEKGGVRQSIRNCLTVFQRDPLLSGAIAYNILTDRKDIIDFLQKELNLHSLFYVPYPAMIVSLVKFFGSDRQNGVLYTDKQRKQLIKWFWRCCFSRRYSSGVNSAHQSDLTAMTKLRDNEDFDASSFKCDISTDFFTDNQFNVNTVNTKTFIAMLASKTPLSFISGAKVDLSITLKQSSTKEFHHIFPDKYLQRCGKAKKEIFPLANFCFLNNADNQKIKDKAPNDYVHMMNSDSIPTILESAICPPNTFEMPYEDFIKVRSTLLLEYANKLISL